MSSRKVYKVGSRQSQLALIQTELVIEQLREILPKTEFETVTFMTIGDKILNQPLAKIGEKSLFTRELEAALKKNEVDFVVHSLKDLPTSLPPKLTIGAVLEREDPRDALIVSKNVNCKTLKDLPNSSVIGTSSLRRYAQLCRKYPNIKVENIRGNLNTRLQKLDQEGSKYSGIILAAAGVKRMRLEARISQLLEPDDFFYAVGQGALAVECSVDNKPLLDILQKLNHHGTVLCVIAERTFLHHLGGGCSAPVAVWTSIKNNELCLNGAVWSLNGEEFLKRSKSTALGASQPPLESCDLSQKAYAGIMASNVSVADLEAAERLGTDLADELISLGAFTIINDAKRDSQNQAG